MPGEIIQTLMDCSSNLSAHDVIVGTIDIKKEKSIQREPDYSTSYEKFDAFKPIWNETNLVNYQAQSLSKLNYLFEKIDQPEHIPVLTELSSKVLVDSAMQCFPNNNQKNKEVKQ